VFRNRDGTPVDPVPFLVVAALAFLVVFSFGPVYAGAVGLSLPVGIALSAGLFVAATVGAYVRLVWNSRPALRAEVPPETRLARLVYGALCLALVMLLLALPLL
jgi:cytochrome b561